MPTYLVIIASTKKELTDAIPLIAKKLAETHQSMNMKKTKVGTAYYGVPFLGKVSYPYGYQKPSKQVIIRVYQKAKKITYTDNDNLLAKTNAQIGYLKNYNCKKLITNYANLLPKEVKDILKFDATEYKFIKIKETENILILKN